MSELQRGDIADVEDEGDMIRILEWEKEWW
jgi:hypothetical protein